jgi:2,3-bisphosphoglycerate-dependent phosphoglycerate mutase
MKKAAFYNNFFKLLLIALLLSNFNALSQKTTVWVVSYAEAVDSTATNKQPVLTNNGQNRAMALLNELKHEDIKAIYITNKRAASMTAAPLAAKDKILPRVYADSVKGLVAKILKNFEGSNVLIVAPYNRVIPFIRALGGNPPFNNLNKDDYDLLFSVTLHNDKAELSISNYGMSHHSTEIPQQYIIQSLNPEFVPPITNH